MKRLLSCLFALLMLACLCFPCVAAQISESPTDVMYRVYDDGVNERVEIACLIPQAIKENALNNSNVSTFIQLDYRIDGGEWASDAENWNYNAGASKFGLTLNKGEGYKILSLLYLNNEGNCQLAGDMAVKNKNDGYSFDLENHTLEFRIRVAKSTDGAVENGPWSETVNVKRDVDFGEVSKEFEKPIVSNPRVLFAEGTETPYLAFDYKTPDSINKTQAWFLTQVPTTFNLVAYVDSGSGFEETTLTYTYSFLADETKYIYLSNDLFEDEKTLKVKLNYYIYEDGNQVFSEESDVLTFQTPRWVEGKGVTKAKCLVCGMCSPIFGVCLWAIAGVLLIVLVIAAVIAKMQIDKKRAIKQQEAEEKQKKIAEQQAAYRAAKAAKKQKNKK